jgi:hypothetical protein
MACSLAAILYLLAALAEIEFERRGRHFRRWRVVDALPCSAKTFASAQPDL